MCYWAQFRATCNVGQVFSRAGSSPCGSGGPILPPPPKLKHASTWILSIFCNWAKCVFIEKSLISESLATGKRHQTLDAVSSDLESLSLVKIKGKERN